MTTLDRRRTAVLVMDYQAPILAMLGADADALVARTAAAVAAARRAGLPVLYVVVAFRPGLPEVPPGNAVLLATAQRFVTTTPGADVPPALAPAEGDAVVAKRRVSAFTGTDLDLLLRVKSIETLVLCGVSTSGVVLSTLRQATDLDYRVVVVRDGCADRDEEVHRVLMDKVFAARAAVLSSAELVEALA